jgi:putative ABC transport system permease protein
MFGGRQQKRYPDISYDQARLFSQTLQNNYGATVSLSAPVGGALQVKYGSNKTNPNVRLVGADQAYLAISGFKIDMGRNFSANDLKNSLNVAIIGQEIAKNLFEQGNPVGSDIVVMGRKLKVIGLLQKKGSLGGGTGNDRLVLVPLETGRAMAANRRLTFDITASISSISNGEEVIEEARGIMRRVRGDALGTQDSFLISRADELAKNFETITGFLRIGGFGIGIITLLGASIALMNIMMVSVTERTREIGIRKSLGATPSVIRFQFLSEAIVICLLGGVGGLLLGILVGNLISTSISDSSGFIVPWLWMILGIVVCVVVGVISGIYPAIKASRLDPIEALRHE